MIAFMEEVRKVNDLEQKSAQLQKKLQAEKAGKIALRDEPAFAGECRSHLTCLEYSAKR